MFIAEPASATPKLGKREAKYLTKKSLKHEFGDSFRYGSGKRISCRDRRSRTRVRCANVRWYSGDTSYRGAVTIWIKRCRGGVSWCWWSKGKIIIQDDYCVHVLKKPRRACTDTRRYRY